VKSPVGEMFQNRKTNSGSTSLGRLQELESLSKTSLGVESHPNTTHLLFVCYKIRCILENVDYFNLVTIINFSIRYMPLITVPRTHMHLLV
jgi:hypothetical protein